MKHISIIIPTYNESGYIGQLIHYLNGNKTSNLLEIIVADGHSTDGTAEEAEQAGARVISSHVKGRSAQMNAGAKVASGSILYFLHADTYPPEKFCLLINTAMEKGYVWGSFRMKFDDHHWFLKLISWFTRFDFSFLRLGDQSLFVTKEEFSEIGGFDDSHIVFEDTDIVKRLTRRSKAKIIPKEVTTSARKFRENGVFTMSLIFCRLWFMYHLHTDQQRILTTYRRLISQDKI
jgi:rSAM/selenodomain-associated transferase 2